MLSTDLTKNYRRRQIPLSEEAVKWLKGMPRRIGIPLVFLRTKVGRGGPGAMIDPTATFFRGAKKAGLHGTGFHDLRRYRATQWHRDLDVREISYLLGHSSIDTTRRYLGIDKGLTERVRAAQDKENNVPAGRQVADTGVKSASEEGVEKAVSG